MGKNDNQIYVIGHINPDTDLRAAAMGYAWLLQETANGENYVAARSGRIAVGRIDLRYPLVDLACYHRP